MSGASTITLAGEIKLLEKWSSNSSKARLLSRASGRALAPALNPKFMEKNGIVRATKPATVRLARGTGRASTHPVMADQMPPWSDSRPRMGILSRFTLSPSNESRPGSSVRDRVAEIIGVPFANQEVGW